MAIPYFLKTATYIYFDNGMIVSYPIDYEKPQSVGRAENLKLKVYDHSLEGTYKRTWRLKAIMDNNAVANHKFSDWLAFVTLTIVYAKYQFSYYDKGGTAYTVRLVDWSEKIIDETNHEVNIVIEEDYA